MRRSGGRNLHLAHDLRSVNLHGLGTDPQLPAYGLVGQSLRRQRQNLPLPRRETLQPFGQHRRCVVGVRFRTAVEKEPHGAGHQPSRKHDRLAAGPRHHRPVGLAEADGVQDDDFALCQIDDRARQRIPVAR